MFVILSLSGKAIHCSRLFRKLMTEDHSYAFLVSCSLLSPYISHIPLLLVEKCYKVILMGVKSNYIRYLVRRNHNSGLIFIIHAGIREWVTPWICLLVEKRMVAHRAKRCAALCSTQMPVTSTLRTGRWTLFLATCLQFAVSQIFSSINPLKPELNPICYLLALLGAHHFLHVSRIRVTSLTFRRLMSYIYIWSTHSWCF